MQIVIREIPAPRVEFMAQDECGTTGVCDCGGPLEHPGGILRLYQCKRCKKFFHRDGISATLACENGASSLYGNPRRTYANTLQIKGQQADTTSNNLHLDQGLMVGVPGDI